MEQVFQDPQVKARKMRIDLPHPAAGTVEMVASPIRMSETPLQYELPPPVLGQHTNEILKPLALTAIREI
jgi:crotonobetainyl-CoA:carnitine CoA-transferase CaiB-like acyl-CoA transferase